MAGLDAEQEDQPQCETDERLNTGRNLRRMFEHEDRNGVAVAVLLSLRLLLLHPQEPPDLESRDCRRTGSTAMRAT